MKTIQLVLVVFFSIAGASCGGGGGGTPSPGATPLAAATITAANEQSVTGAALDAGMGSIMGGSLTPVGVQSSTATAAPNNRVLSRLTTTAVQKIAEYRNAPH